MRRIIPYFVTLIVFVAMDAVWLTLTGSMYRHQIGPLLAPEVRWIPGIAFYLLQVLGMQVFVLPRALNAAKALGFGSAFGIFTYGTYDLTNWAVLKDWTYSMSFMDMVWGAVVTGVASMAGYFALRSLEK